MAEECVYPASINQETRLLTDEVNADFALRRPPHFPIAFRISDPYDHAALERAWHTIVRRHEVLRTSFRHTSRYPLDLRAIQVQVYGRTGLFLPGLYDSIVCDDGEERLREQHIDSADESTIARIVDEEIEHAIASGTLHVPRALVVRTSAGTRLFITVLSHVVVDGWSVHILQRELVALYAAYVRGEPDPLKPAGQYRSFSLAQHRQVVTNGLERESTYWLQAWKEMDEAIVSHDQLPFARRAVAPPSIKRIMRVVGDAESAVIVETARRLRTTPYIIFRAALTIVLHTYTRKRRIAVWANFANRQAWYEDMFGWCANTHLVPVAVSALDSWSTLVRDVSAAMLEGQANEAVPLTAIWRYSGCNLGIKCRTRINMDFVWSRPGMRAANPLEPVVVPGGRRWMDLDFRVRMEQGAFTLLATYDSSRYTDDGVAATVEHICRVVTVGVMDESATVRSCAALVA